MDKFRSLESIIKEMNMNRNTELRKKVTNVARPDTATDPTDVKSKIAKQGEIKNKIIDEANQSSAHKMAKMMAHGFAAAGHKAELHPDGSATVHTKPAHDNSYSSANVVDSHLKHHGFMFNHPAKAYDNHKQSMNGHSIHVTKTPTGHAIHIKSNNVKEQFDLEEAKDDDTSDKVAAKSKETPKKDTKSDESHMDDPKKVKGGKTEVDVEPVTDDRLSDESSETKQADKARKKANKEIGQKTASVKEEVELDEVEQIDEISKKLAARYNNKVSREVNKNQPAGKDAMRKRNNREAGLKLSSSKYHGYKVKVPATEEVNQDDKPPFAGPYDKATDAKDKNVAKNAARKKMKEIIKKVTKESADLAGHEVKPYEGPEHTVGPDGKPAIRARTLKAVKDAITKSKHVKLN